jgi:hypothetical protein
MGAIAHEMGIHATYEPPLTESNAKKRSTLMGQFRRPRPMLTKRNTGCHSQILLSNESLIIFPGLENLGVTHREQSMRARLRVMDKVRYLLVEVLEDEERWNTLVIKVKNDNNR